MFKNILVTIHLQYIENHPKVLSTALKVLAEDGKITLLFVNENMKHGSVSPLMEETNQKNYNKEALEQLKQIADKYSVPREKVNFKIREGVSHQEIIEEAKKIKADTIIMMASRPGLKSYFIGTTAERVIRHANCSVFVLRHTDK
ncbi:universal stress protein [bacterium]|nr:universal stress protein [bacterium]